ncbi:MAG: hypothetical protein HY258_07510 [Chloroflexi bacterium]|nr:hypothetical protein [Chloroflexota bacterium]
MSALIPFLALDQTCAQAQAWVNEKLTGAGFRVVQTFDLQVARLAHPDCPCPHHETEDCTCQMIVLLIYRNKSGPVTLILHGRDSQTWLSLASPLMQRADRHLEAAILHALTPQPAEIPSPIEAAYETRSTI